MDSAFRKKGASAAVAFGIVLGTASCSAATKPPAENHDLISKLQVIRQEIVVVKGKEYELTGTQGLGSSDCQLSIKPAGKDSPINLFDPSTCQRNLKQTGV